MWFTTCDTLNEIGACVGVTDGDTVGETDVNIEGDTESETEGVNVGV